MAFGERGKIGTLKNRVGMGTAYNYDDLELSTQLIIGEAMRRNVEVEILDRNDNFIRLRKGDKTEYVKQAARTSVDTYISPLIMENKFVTKKLVVEAGIRVPAGEQYNDIDTAVTAYFSGLDIVVKPNSTNFGKGITILNERHSERDYKEAVKLAFGYDDSIIIEGEEYRFLIIGDRVSAVLQRVPANVEGDGRHSIQELVRKKNEDPLRGKGCRTPLERISLGEVENDFLVLQGRSFDDIPEKGEWIFLRENSIISTGGDSIDYTDRVSEGYEEIAVEAARVVGARICGADIIIQDIQADPKKENYAVIELNFNPALHIHCYPYKGDNRHPERAVLNLLGF